MYDITVIITSLFLSVYASIPTSPGKFRKLETASSGYKIHYEDLYKSFIFIFFNSINECVPCCLC